MNDYEHKKIMTLTPGPAVGFFSTNSSTTSQQATGRLAVWYTVLYFSSFCWEIDWSVFTLIIIATVYAAIPERSICYSCIYAYQSSIRQFNTYKLHNSRTNWVDSFCFEKLHWTNYFPFIFNSFKFINSFVSYMWPNTTKGTSCRPSLLWDNGQNRVQNIKKKETSDGQDQKGQSHGQDAVRVCYDLLCQRQRTYRSWSERRLSGINCPQEEVLHCQKSAHGAMHMTISRIGGFSHAVRIHKSGNLRSHNSFN